MSEKIDQLQIEPPPVEEKKDEALPVVDSLDPLNISEKTLEELKDLRTKAEEEAAIIQQQLDGLMKKRDKLLSQVVRVDFLWTRKCEAYGFL